MDNPGEVVEWLVNHRLQRESKVMAGLQQLGRSSVEDLVKVVYDDVDTSLHKMAMLSLSAHLIKLGQESRAVLHAEDDCWELIEP